MTRLLALLPLPMLLACTGSPEAVDTPLAVDSAEPQDTAETGGPWRSALYPEAWEPGYEVDGNMLHDVSYAGYHNGEEAPTEGAGLATFDVTELGADPTGVADSTGAIQGAIDAAAEAGGGRVWLPEGTYLVEGVLTVTHDHTVVAGAGAELTRLVFTRSSGMSDQEHLAFDGAVTEGADLLLTTDGSSGSATVELDAEQAAELAVGDEVALGWVITPDFVEDHAMTGIWKVSNDQWRAFFLRRIVAIDGATVTLDVPLRYPALTRDGASLRVQTGHLREVGVQDLSLSTAVAWSEAWANDRSHAIGFGNVRDAWVLRVVSFAADTPADDRGRHLQSGGVVVRDSARVTIADTHLAYPQNRGEGGNGYLFEVSQSAEVLIADCWGQGGRHNFIQNWDFGTSGVVFLRTRSTEGFAVTSSSESVGSTGNSEFHHQLAMANLIDHSETDDGWQALNRWSYSSGAGHTATETVFWNTSGAGSLTSYQFGRGYVIGTSGLEVVTEADDLGFSNGTLPSDWTEGVDQGGELEPASLYEDQLERRLARGGGLW